jgi:3-hydroxyisobutyrate dehydrogenase-like beta-hydroxyacid dehydrogenase
VRQRVAVIGTGAIGSPMARCLIRTGFSTTVYDVRREAVEPLMGMGAKGAESVADCADSDVIVIVVANDMQVEDVIAGPGGILNHLHQDVRPVLVIMSTVSPETVRRLGDLCRGKGVEIIDAPVSGGHVAAENGNLSVMVGGSKETFERMKPVLSVIGRRLYYIGELGAGETMKLVNNLIGVTNMFLTIEALAIGVRNGVPLDTLLSIIDTSSGSNFHTRNWPTAKAFFSDFAKNSDSARNNLSLCIKDLTHAQELAVLAKSQSPLLKGLIEALKEMTPEYLVDEWSTVVTRREELTPDGI